MVRRTSDHVLSSYQYHRTFHFHHASVLIGSFDHPHISAGKCFFAFEHSIPSFKPSIGFEHELPVPVVNPEVICFLYANGYRAEYIIQSITVRGKGVGYIIIRAFVYFDEHPIYRCGLAALPMPELKILTIEKD